MFPCKGLWIAIGTGNNGNEDQDISVFLQGSIHIMCFQQAIMRIDIKIDTYLFLEG